MALAAAMLWGSTGTTQALLPVPISPLWVGAIRLAIAAAFLLAWFSWRRPGGREPVAPWPWALLGASAVCIGVYNLAFFSGVREAGVALGTAVAIGSSPVWAGVLQALIRRRLPEAGWWVGAGAAIAGVALLMQADSAASAGSWRGWALCLGAGLAYALYALIGQGLAQRVSAETASAVVFSGAALITLAAAFAVDGLLDIKSSASELAWVLVALAWLGIVGTGIAYLLFNHALARISGPTAVVLALAEPVTAVLLAIVLLGERPTGVAIAGLALVLAGLVRVVSSELRGRPADPGPE